MKGVFYCMVGVYYIYLKLLLYCDYSTIYYSFISVKCYMNITPHFTPTLSNATATLNNTEKIPIHQLQADWFSTQKKLQNTEKKLATLTAKTYLLLKCLTILAMYMFGIVVIFICHLVLFTVNISPHFYAGFTAFFVVAYLFYELLLKPYSIYYYQNIKEALTIQQQRQQTLLIFAVKSHLIPIFHQVEKISLIELQLSIDDKQLHTSVLKLALDNEIQLGNLRTSISKYSDKELLGKLSNKNQLWLKNNPHLLYYEYSPTHIRK